jgi:RNA polymerase sigma factor (sigma-70 family)
MLTLAVNNNQTQAQAYKTIENHFRQNFERLVPRYQRFLNSKERAEDVLQEAYCRACTYWSDAPSDETEFTKWFHTILGNAMKDNHRDEIRKGATSNADASDDEGYEGAAIPAIIYRQVRQRIEAKPEAHSRILSLALLQQYRPAEIEQLTKETQGNIRQIVSRFRREIREEFGWRI